RQRHAEYRSCCRYPSRRGACRRALEPSPRRSSRGCSRLRLLGRLDAVRVAVVVGYLDDLLDLSVRKVPLDDALAVAVTAALRKQLVSDALRDGFCAVHAFLAFLCPTFADR